MKKKKVFSVLKFIEWSARSHGEAVIAFKEGELYIDNATWPFKIDGLTRDEAFPYGFTPDWEIEVDDE